MKTNCKEVFEETINTWSVVEEIDFNTTLKLIGDGNKNVVVIHGDSCIYESVNTLYDVFNFDDDGMEFYLVRYYEHY